MPIAAYTEEEMMTAIADAEKRVLDRLEARHAIEIARLNKLANEARSLIDQALGDTDPQDPDYPLLRACQVLSEALR